MWEASQGFVQACMQFKGASGMEEMSAGRVWQDSAVLQRNFLISWGGEPGSESPHLVAYIHT